jgi:heme/copper-type cytochrome/quinol oxidase subunit 3
MSGTTFSPTNSSHAAVRDAAAPFVPRKRTLQIGTALFTSMWVMYFGGLFGSYVSARNTWNLTQDGLAASGESVTSWIPNAARVELTAPTVITWTLLMSCITMQWAVYSFKRSDRRHALIALATQAMFGTAVINQVVFQWKQLGLVIDDTSGSSAASLIYTITASHVAMIIVAMCLLAFAAFRALASSDTKDHVDVAASAATFWYAMVGLYFIIWILIFITK